MQQPQVIHVHTPDHVGPLGRIGLGCMGVAAIVILALAAGVAAWFLIGLGAVAVAPKLEEARNNSAAPMAPEPAEPEQARESTQQPPQRAYMADVARVIDGDTFELSDGTRVRLVCVDTPERGQPGYTEAAEFLRGLVEGKRVILEKDPQHADHDAFGRKLRVAWIDGTQVNAAIINAGHSAYWTRYGKSAEIESELDARD